MDEATNPKHTLDEASGHRIVKEKQGTTTGQGLPEGRLNEPSEERENRKLPLFTPDERLGQSSGVWQCLRTIITASWLNVLLVFVPISWTFDFADDQRSLLLFSFLAIIPLAKLIALSTDELYMRTGWPIANFVHDTCGNAIELLVAIIALMKCELAIVQSLLIGSVLSNLLLVYGGCLCVGGIKFSKQGLDANATKHTSSLLYISVFAVLLPTAFRFLAAVGIDPHPEQVILNFSRAAAVLLLAIYARHFSHLSKREEALPKLGPLVASVLFFLGVIINISVIPIGRLTSSALNLTSNKFIGVIFLPLARKVADHAHVVFVPTKGNLTRSLKVTHESSIEMLFAVVPLVTLLGWILNKPFTLLFDPLESIALVLAVLTVHYIRQDQNRNPDWFSGAILLIMYGIFATTFYYYPGTPKEFSNILPQCH